MKIKTQLCVSVEDFVDGETQEDIDNAFEMAQTDGFNYLKGKYSDTSLVIHSADYIDTDGSNWTHAAAFYDVIISGQQEYLHAHGLMEDLGDTTTILED